MLLHQNESYETFCILIGGLVGLLSSLLTTLMNFALERKRQNAQWQYEIEIKKSELRQKEIEDARNLLEKSNREKMSKIVVPQGKLACFPGFTPITLSNKDHKRIEEAKAGDEVLSFDVDAKTLTKGVVTTVKTDEVQVYIIVNDLLHVTQSHGVFINLNGRLVSGPAGNLNLANYLVNETGEKILVTSLQLKIEHTKVYNLELESNKPFFASGILVGDLFSKAESGCGRQNSTEAERAARKRKDLREELLRDEEIIFT